MGKISKYPMGGISKGKAGGRDEGERKEKWKRKDRERKGT